MNLLDWLLVALVLAYALSGYWQGFVTGAFATGGLLIGGLFGVWLAPMALGDATPSLLVSLGALFIVILSASLGQALLQYTGAKIRDRITWQPIRALDALGGAALSAAAVLLVAWALGVAVSGTRIAAITPMVRSSAVLKEVDHVLPQSAGGVLQAFNDVVGTSFFPRYLEPFAPERIVEVGPGPRRQLRDPDVAVLALDSGATPHLTFDLDAEAQAPVAILGYPQDGPYDVQPGRIRAEQRLRSPNIYNRGTVIREVYSLRGLVRPGNSGGPIVSSAGDVVGVVFAASVTDDETGYALTADQVSQSAATGVTNDAEVSTGDCVS